MECNREGELQPGKHESVEIYSESPQVIGE
jgi:hypothetical protein